MKIVARAMTAVPFVIFNGTREQMVKIPRHVSFHLMVTLNDGLTAFSATLRIVGFSVRRCS